MAVAHASLAFVLNAAEAIPSYDDIDAAPHNYHARTPRDRFTGMMQRLEDDAKALDRSSEKAFLVSLLKTLDIPVSSQTLVFSTTSLQLSLISPSNPRAIYFNEEIYVGYVPGGRIEIVSLDPELGGIYYIFDIPRDDRPLRFDRSNRCMHCHASEDTGWTPGLVIKSVVPGPVGGSLDAFRGGKSGHGIPFADRFGGWHVTGEYHLTNHWGNATGKMVDGEIVKIANPPGTRFSFAKYPVATSDILPHLLHEHQAGFVNRVVEAAYRTRTALHASGGRLTVEQSAELDQQAEILTRYILFADEVPLPEGGIGGDAAFKEAFLRNRRASADGVSFKDFDLRTRLFKYRCSYMIYTSIFEALPSELKGRVYKNLNGALRNDPVYAYLPAAEKIEIRSLLKATLKDLPPDW